VSYDELKMIISRDFKIAAFCHGIYFDAIMIIFLLNKTIKEKKQQLGGKSLNILR
jgi:hypothetical protein